MPGRSNFVVAKSRRSAFTLIEVMVAAVLVAVGAVSLVAALAGFTRAELAVQDRDLVSLLAHQKLDELVATQGYLDQTSGNFQASGLESYTWEAQTEFTGTAGLNYLRVIVTSPEDRTMEAETLYFITEEVIDTEVEQ